MEKWKNGEIKQVRKWESDTKSEWSKEKVSEQRRKNVKVLGGGREIHQENRLKVSA